MRSSMVAQVAVALPGPMAAHACKAAGSGLEARPAPPPLACTLSVGQPSAAACAAAVPSRNRVSLTGRPSCWATMPGEWRQQGAPAAPRPSSAGSPSLRTSRAWSCVVTLPRMLVTCGQVAHAGEVHGWHAGHAWHGGKVHGVMHARQACHGEGTQPWHASRHPVRPSPTSPGKRYPASHLDADNVAPRLGISHGSCQACRLAWRGQGRLNHSVPTLCRSAALMWEAKAGCTHPAGRQVRQGQDERSSMSA